MIRIKVLLVIFVLAANGCSRWPPRKMRLPPGLNEVSGLAYAADRDSFYLHNDSGDGPRLYRISAGKNPTPAVTEIAADARDWEDLCRDPDGRIYLGDFGNNFGRRENQSVYRYDPNGHTVDTLAFLYPDQKGTGRLDRGNYDCEAMIWYGDSLHLFTKALPGVRKRYWAYHFRLAVDRPLQTATLVDSLYLPRRTITGADYDPVRDEVVLVSYNFKRWLGFLPVVASSLITLRNFPPGRFFDGDLKRRNLSWGKPIQYEAVAVYDERYWYAGTEKTRFQRRAFLRRKRRF